MEVKLGRDGCCHKAQRGQRPDEAYLRLGHEHEQTGKEQCFKENPEQNVAVGYAAPYQIQDSRHAHLSQIADLLEPAAKKDDADGFEDQSDNENRKQLGHEHRTKGPDILLAAHPVPAPAHARED